MKLQNIKKSYDLIVSLGMSCAPAINLQRHGLRKFSMPLDWMISSSLTDVNGLLKNKFQNFMQLENLHKLEETHYLLNDGSPVYASPNEKALAKSHLIRDSLYNIISVHDFPSIEGRDWTQTYPAYRKKLDLRISRFWDRLISSNNILFIRWSADYEQVAELQSVLFQQLMKNNFTILVLNPVSQLNAPQDGDWGIRNVCAMKVPNDMNDYASWDYILKGFHLTND